MAYNPFVNLYVEEPLKSAELYSRLFGLQPITVLPTYVLYQLESGLKIGLWARNATQPPAQSAPGASEVVFQVGSDEEVDKLFTQWTAEGLVVAQTPSRESFGYTFVVADPDGHRLRVYKFAGASEA